jgi:hypothetical protein
VAYLSNFEHDIFISHAHGPENNLSILPDEETRFLQRWTQTLAHNITQLVDFYLKQVDARGGVSAWIDRRLEKTLPVGESLERHVKNSAVFVVIMSAFYLESRYCLDELRWFKDSSADEPPNQGRIFVVRVGRTDRNLWPQSLKSKSGSSVDGYQFYKKTEVDQQFFDPFGWPEAQVEDRDYWMQVKVIARDITKQLCELKNLECKESNHRDLIPDGSNGSLVRSRIQLQRNQTSDQFSQKLFLAYMHDTLFTERARLRRKLTELGFSIVPEEQDDPVDAESLNVALEQLAGCDAAVLIANEYCGKWPRQEAAGFVGLQVRQFRERNIPLHVWVKIEDTKDIQTKEYASFLRSEWPDCGIFSNLDEFCQNIAQIRSAFSGIEMALVLSNRPSDEDVYRTFQETIVSAISETGRLILTPDASPPMRHLTLTSLESNLKDVDTITLVCFDQRWEWISKMMIQLRQMKTGMRKRYRLLVTGPKITVPMKVDCRFLNFETIDGASLDFLSLKSKVRDSFMRR